MKIELDLDLLRDEALTANEFVHMYLVSQGQYSEAWIQAPLQGYELKGLAHTGYIRLNPFDTIEGWDNLPPEPRIQLQEKALLLFKKPVSEYRWNEFRDVYPKKSGERPLHTDLEKNKKKFLGYCGTPGVFEDIMKGLRNELLARESAKRKGEFMPEWRMIGTWLNNKSWETYLDYQVQSTRERTRGV